MYRDDIILQLNDLLDGFLSESGLVLVDLIYRYESGKLALRLLCDHPQGGITIEECAELNRKIGALLDEKGILSESYVLEVSSPGLDRPLKSDKDFLRCLNRRVRIFFNEQVDGKWEAEGMVRNVDLETLYVDIDGNQSAIPLAKIAKAKQII